MLIIGCDFHARFQQIAMLDGETGEIRERWWSAGWSTREVRRRGFTRR